MGGESTEEEPGERCCVNRAQWKLHLLEKSVSAATARVWPGVKCLCSPCGTSNVCLMDQPGSMAVTHGLSYIFMDVLLYWQLYFEEQVAALFWSLYHLVVHCVPLCELQKGPLSQGLVLLG